MLQRVLLVLPILVAEPGAELVPAKSDGTGWLVKLNEADRSFGDVESAGFVHAEHHPRSGSGTLLDVPEDLHLHEKGTESANCKNVIGKWVTHPLVPNAVVSLKEERLDLSGIPVIVDHDGRFRTKETLKRLGAKRMRV